MTAAGLLRPTPPGFYWRVLSTAILTAAAVTAAFAAFGTFFTIGLPAQAVNCLPYRAFLVTKKAPALSSIHRGDYLGFMPPLSQMGELGKIFAGHQIVKEVAGLPGDIITVKDDFASVAGRPIGKLDLIARLGKPSGAFDRVEVIPPGHVLMIGTMPRSYDGRYWGTVPYENVVSRAYPLL